MSEMVLSNSELRIEATVSPIIFISDLHFDYTKHRFKAKAAPQMKDDFIAFVKEKYSESILCLAGDYFDNYENTLSFMKEMEEKRIAGFFVLGNHDYWNDCTKSHNDIISLFSSEMCANRYFRFLSTGSKYYYRDICVIGDTGWTSFRRDGHEVELSQFMGLPETRRVKDFSPHRIIALHDKWASFANDVLSVEKKVLIVTHFPMVDFTRKDKDC